MINQPYWKIGISKTSVGTLDPSFSPPRTLLSNILSFNESIGILGTDKGFILVPKHQSFDWESVGKDGNTFHLKL